MADLEAQVADAIISAAESNKSAIVAQINALEGGVETFLANAIANVKVGGVVLPLIWSSIKPAVIAELVALEQAESGTVIFTLLDADAHAFAKSIGG